MKILAPGRQISRRSLLVASAGIVGGAVINTASDAITFEQPVAPSSTDLTTDPTKVLGRIPSPLGTRAASEQLQRFVAKALPSGNSRSPLQHLVGIITPSDLHFERHHGGIPEIIPDDYELLIHGMVERPLKFSLHDLKRFPQHTKICFIECSGNGFQGYHKTDASVSLSPQELDGLISTSEWTGVKLSTLFREVGIKPGAKWFLAEGSDAAVLSRSIPMEKAYDDAMVALGQNGEAIRPEQGYPARLLLPGWEGNTHVKWLRRLEVADRPFMTREETSKYTDPLPDCTARLFSFVMDAKSLITFPAFPYVLPEKGWWEIRGMAWSGRGRITKVEVSTDAGRNWYSAELGEPVLPKCQTQFRFLWNWNGKETTIMSRATDETGYIQPTYGQLKKVRGEGTMYHFNHIRAWKILSNGHVMLGLNEMI